MNDERNRFYISLDTHERIPATYQVHLTMPAYYDAWIDIEATSEQEATEIALASAWRDADWQCDRGDAHSIEVYDVECKEPPDDGFLVELDHYSSNASIETLFEADLTSDSASHSKEDLFDADNTYRRDGSCSPSVPV